VCAGSFEDPFHDKQRALLAWRGHETRPCCTVRSAVEVSMLLTQMQAAGANASASHPPNAETLLVCNDGGIQGVGYAITTSWNSPASMETRNSRANSSLVQKQPG